MANADEIDDVVEEVVENEVELTAKKLIKAFVQFKRLRIDEGKLNSIMYKSIILKHSEIMLLYAIKEMEQKHPDGISVSDISTHLGVKPPTITPIITSLEEKDMLDRTMDPNDRRIIRIKLKDEGEKLIKKASQHLISHLKGLVSYLGAEKSAQLADLINEAYYYVSTIAPNDKIQSSKTEVSYAKNLPKP